MTFTQYQIQPVLDLIGRYESRGDYEIVYGGIPKASRPAKLTAMTIAQVLDWQRRVVNAGSASSAAGKYQIIRKTLEASVAALSMSSQRLFDKTAQDMLAMHLLRGRGMQRFLDGQIDADDMALGLAKEWASLPVPSAMKGASRQVMAGQSYYAGDGLNKAHATVAEVEQALLIARERYRSKATAPQTTTTEAPSGGIIAAIAAFFTAIFGLKG
ncbi:hypothetical protein [Paracoccus sp. (in: a-proteobacteria)]|uniref:hypothetical protein n=1 Tax=Paracoccus sp. TaxID=267 RepID=UPI002AFF2831|nr:hypothetical protein [Paracoccus sp. (in: a-proteobacteria)]